MGTSETRLTVCDLCLTHVMCARNSVFKTVCIAAAMALMTPSNFCKSYHHPLLLFIFLQYLHSFKQEN